MLIITNQTANYNIHQSLLLSISAKASSIFFCAETVNSFECAPRFAFGFLILIMNLRKINIDKKQNFSAFIYIIANVHRTWSAISYFLFLLI